MRQTHKNVSANIHKTRTAYVTVHITEALIKLLKEKPMSEIFVNEICDEAGVARASFYRNFSSKEEILQNHIRKIMKSCWGENTSDNQEADSGLYETLFSCLKQNEPFFKLLKERNLFYLFYDVFVELYGPKPDNENIEAYLISFVTHGTYGWIEEWVARGMQESSETMIALLNKIQNKSNT